MQMTLDEFFEELKPYRDTLQPFFVYKPALSSTYFHCPSFYKTWATVTQRSKLTGRQHIMRELRKHASYLHEKLVRIDGKPMRAMGLNVSQMSQPMLELLVPLAQVGGGQHQCYCATGLLITRGCQCGGI